MTRRNLSKTDEVDAITAAHILNKDIFGSWPEEKRRAVIVTWAKILREPAGGERR